MAFLTIDSENALHYLHAAPARAAAPTFVFVNALTGSTDHWEAAVAPGLRDAGFGTLSWNFRGQAESRFAPGTALTPALIVEDLRRLLDELSPQRPVLSASRSAACSRRRRCSRAAPPAASCSSTRCARSARASPG